MMLYSNNNGGKQSCSLLAVVCEHSKLRKGKTEVRKTYPFPELVSSCRLEVKTLSNPSLNEFRRTLELLRPNVVYLQGEVLSNDEIGGLIWDGVDVCNVDTVFELFGNVLPNMVYLEISNGEELADAIHSKGVPYVIFWQNSFSCYAASHFRHALFSVLQSSPCHPWDAFQLAHASFRLYCIRNNSVPSKNGQKSDDKLGPSLFGEAPNIDVVLPVADNDEHDESSEANVSAVKIHNDYVGVRFLICGGPCSLDAYLLGCLEDGINALLAIEIRASKLQNRFSAPPPPPQAGSFSRGVVTMRCDISTCSSAYVSLLVSGSAQTCFDDQQLENHIKKEAIERSQLVQAIQSSEEIELSSDPRTSVSIACGAAVFEVCLKAPSWALQILRQLAPDTSYRSLVALGIASIQGSAVASFEKVDAERLLYFCSRRGKYDQLPYRDFVSPPTWLRPPPPCRNSLENVQGSSFCSNSGVLPKHKVALKTIDQYDNEGRYSNEAYNHVGPICQKSKVAAMRPIPQTYARKMIPFSGLVEADSYDAGHVKLKLTSTPHTKNNVLPSNPSSYKRSSNTFQAKQQIVSLNPIPLKKHGCGRAPIHLCSEDDFLKDVMQFLVLRGHNRLVPQAGFAEFPDAILNSKRLDLYSLYREVVSRGGFHVGNGINWKGQVFSKMRNYTATNKMTGVGNTLKRHYEAYLLEYELAHDDVDGECCLLCHSSAAGDWVNCGICGEWAHFGCDRRQGLGAFKDYAKTDGLEYICPNCSVTNFRKKMHKPSNGYSDSLAYS